MKAYSKNHFKLCSISWRKSHTRGTEKWKRPHESPFVVYWKRHYGPLLTNICFSPCFVLVVVAVVWKPIFSIFFRFYFALSQKNEHTQRERATTPRRFLVWLFHQSCLLLVKSFHRYFPICAKQLYTSNHTAHTMTFFWFELLKINLTYEKVFFLLRRTIVAFELRKTGAKPDRLLGDSLETSVGRARVCRQMRPLQFSFCCYDVFCYYGSRSHSFTYDAVLCFLLVLLLINMMHLKAEKSNFRQQHTN